MHHPWTYSLPASQVIIIYQNLYYPYKSNHLAHEKCISCESKHHHSWATFSLLVRIHIIREGHHQCLPGDSGEFPQHQLSQWNSYRKFAQPDIFAIISCSCWHLKTLFWRFLPAKCCNMTYCWIPNKNLVQRCYHIRALKQWTMSACLWWFPYFEMIGLEDIRNTWVISSSPYHESHHCLCSYALPMGHTITACELYHYFPWGFNLLSKTFQCWEVFAS